MDITGTANVLNADTVAKSPPGAQQRHIRDQTNVGRLDCRKVYPVYSQLERTILALNGIIRNKINWQRKIYDSTIIAKWKAELRDALGPRQNTDDEDAMLDIALWASRLTELAATVEGVDDRSARQLEATCSIQELRSTQPAGKASPVCSPVQIPDYSINEAKAVAEYFNGNVIPAAVQGVYQADNCGNDEPLKDQREALLAFATKVENADKDWHPGTDGQTVVLRTETIPSPADSLRFINTGEALPSTADKEINAPWFAPHRIPEISDEFQWLPTDVKMAYTGNENRVRCEFESYINNVHPVKFRAEYDLLASIFAGFVPMFTHVLTDLLNQDQKRLDLSSGVFYEEYGDEDDDADEEDDGMWYDDTRDRIVAYPTIPEAMWQIVVKMANIELTPEKPSYPGGSFHLEGTDREDIVATGIYYYSIENITASRLSFKSAFNAEESHDGSYEQNDHVGIKEVLGVDADQQTVQLMGSVEAVEGRCIVFPKYKVEKFSRADPTRSGHRKILCFFLVNPQNTDVLSTSRVPPLQSDWLWGELLDTVPRLRNLPPELLAHIRKYAETPLSLHQAKERRIRFMKARKAKAG
ncbi:hypothetical protein HDU86_008536 [Geranomyces michiganensis]|nr:hypothetical protein HDU86_008536 [Geranomyces michiganensis]